MINKELLIKIISLRYYGNHNHTEMSNLRLLDCNIKVERLIDEAVKLGLNGISITDHESISGHIRAIQKAKELREKGIDFTIGLGDEIYLTDDELNSENYIGGTKFPHFIIVAKDMDGHRLLREITSTAWGNRFKTGAMERVPISRKQLYSIVSKNRGHLVSSSACLGGSLGILYNRYITEESSEIKNTIIQEVYDFVGYCKDLFGEDFYLELQPSFNEEQIGYNKFLINLGKLCNIKTIFTTDTHYSRPEMKTLHKSLLQSKQGDREVDDFYETTYLMSTEEVWDYFKGYIELDYFENMINNTNEIRNKIEFYDLKRDTIVPQINVPPFSIKNSEFCNADSKYEYIHKYINSDHLIDKYLIFKLEEGMKLRNKPFDSTYLSRINVELEQLWFISDRLNSRLSSYYLLVQEVVDLMWTITLVGCGRGSANGYLLNYLLDITQVNPLDFDLPYWRHISKERVELPDIDVDSESNKRQEIFKLIKEKYGYDKVINIGTFKTLKPKASIQTAGRGLGYNNDDIQAISDMIPVERGNQWSLDDCINGNEEKDRKPIKEFIKAVSNFPNLLESAMSMEGLIVGRSIHASGLYIYSDNYMNYVARMKAPNGEDITCWSMNDSDYVGSLKMDELTIEALDKQRATMDLLIKDDKIQWQGTLKKTYDKYLHPDLLEYKSKDMYELLFNGDVVDAFQYETELAKQVLKKLHATKLEEIIAGNSIMRLANKGGEQPLDRYVRFKNDISQWYDEMKEWGLTEEEIKVLEEHLLVTYGVCDTQESLMLLCMDKRISGFDLTQANYIRKAIAKKKEKLVAKSYDLFYKQGLELGTRKELLDYIWEMEIKPQLGLTL